MLKSPDAFRTISEVAEDLDLPQHVLRFWETRFPQIRPLKRAGGRRYYRPADVLLLRSIRQLLYDDGYTIKGVQRLLKEQGARSFRADDPAVPDAGSVALGDFDTVPAVDRAYADPDAIAIAADPVDRLDPEDTRCADPDATLPLVQAEPPCRTDDLAALRGALSIVEECAAILRAARQDRS